MNDDYPRTATEVEIYTLGPPLYDEDNAVVGCAISRIRDTTNRKGGLPLMLDGVRVGTALEMKSARHEQHEAICFLCVIEEHGREIESLRAADGRIWADRIAAAMWTSGIYPTAIHLRGETRPQMSRSANGMTNRRSRESL